MDSFWNHYSEYAPKKFLNHLQYEKYFKQRWWEMYLGVGLINIGLDIETSNIDKGPDFRVNFDNEKMNIEAVAPKMGNGIDKLHPMKLGVHSINNEKEKYLLRLSSAIKEKKDKFEKYLNDNTIGENDINIIALSSCALDQYGSLMDYPVSAPVTILCDVHNQFINLETKQVGYTQKSGISKSSGNIVDTNIFNTKGYEIISAVIYSNTDLLNSPDNPESTFVLIINSNAKNMIEEKTIRRLCCNKIYKSNCNT